jgi:hypothetical protein
MSVTIDSLDIQIRSSAGSAAANIEKIFFILFSCLYSLPTLASRESYLFFVNAYFSAGSSIWKILRTRSISYFTPRS